MVAIGNPFGLGQTVTSGIVSALGPQRDHNGKYEDFIQTDASINPGNSGGALINSKGELVGINTAILAPNGGNVGIGFAVPANMARSVMDQLLRFGAVRRGRIGVVIQDLPPEAAEHPGPRAGPGRHDRPGGAGLAGRACRHPRGRRGARGGRGQVHGSGELRNRIGLIEADQDVQLEILRDGRRPARVKVRGDADAGTRGRRRAGRLRRARAEPIPPDHPAYGQVDGVLVAGVARGSPAAGRRLRRGDIILGVDGRPSASLEELDRGSAAGGRAHPVDLLRGDRELALVIGLSAPLSSWTRAAYICLISSGCPGVARAERRFGATRRT